MSSSLTVRSHLRGLDVLRALNSGNYASVLELSRATELPRPTVYRLLDTLIEAGLVLHDRDSDVFCLTGKVRELSCGFDERALAVDVARPYVREFSLSKCWPSYLLVRDGDAMVTRLIVRSPRALAYPKMSKRFAMSESSSGRLLLSSLDAKERDRLLARELNASQGHAPTTSLDTVQRLIRDADLLGCGFRDEGIVPRTCSIALPVRREGRTVLYWTIVFMRSVFSVNKALDAYLPDAKRVVQAIEDELAEA